MDDFKKCMVVDKALIIVGAMGVIGGIVAIILAVNGTILLDLNYILLIPLAGFFIYWGIKQMKKDKEKYHVD